MVSRQHLADLLLVSGVVLLSAVLYVGGLGFYSDAWKILADLAMSGESSLSGLFEAAETPADPMRPVHLLYMSAMYWLFGTEALGYHLVNNAALLASMLALYVALRALGVGRGVTLAITLLSALLPGDSTNRVWYPALQIHISLIAYLLSLYASVQAAHRTALRAACSLAASLALCVFSLLAYEQILPFFLANPLIVWLHLARSATEGRSQVLPTRRLCVIAALTWLVVAVVLAFKILQTDRMQHIEPLSQIVWFARLLALGAIQSFVDYGVALPKSAWALLDDWRFAALGLGVALGVYYYLRRIDISSWLALPRIRYLVLAGCTVHVLGYAIFLTNRQIIITPAGLGNRAANISTIGAAICFVGACLWLCSKCARPPSRRHCFAAAIAVICGLGTVTNNGIAAYWVAASQRQAAVLDDIAAHIPELPPGSTLLLNGVCPYVGPGIVFEAPWDLTGALRIRYRDETLRGDIMTGERLDLFAAELQTSIYGERSLYPYGADLLVYDYRSKRLGTLESAAAAHRYLDDNPTPCLLSRAGHGVPVVGGLLDILFELRFRPAHK